METSVQNRAPRTETARARAAMTDQSRAALPEQMLSARLGRGTLAGALNSQIRFRVEHAGATKWRLHPDSPLAHDLVGSPAGAGVVDALKGILKLTERTAGVSNIKGIGLSPDLRAVAASFAFDTMQDDGVERDAALADAADGALDPEYMKVARHFDATTIAHNTIPTGWVWLGPMVSRALLTAKDAYSPTSADEPYLHDPQTVQWVTKGIIGHEMQHGVTPGKGVDMVRHEWLEEGIANLLTAWNLPALSGATGITERSYANALQAEDTFKTGWRPAKQTLLPTQPERGELDKKADEMWNAKPPHVAVAQLLALAGALPVDDNQEAANAILQGRPVRHVPGELADAIIARQGLEPGIRERLRRAILATGGDPAKVDRLAVRFGMTGRDAPTEM